LIVLKGHYTATVRPDGKVFFNSSGTPAMATAGSGDVLTGIITSLLAQGYKPESASVAGVYIHGLAGEIAADTHGEYGTTGMDIADAVGRAIKVIME
ncbi:MAG: bifunctional ADP-dependent NAD(P)H-hydrate dehydratase/NAD(P)H-hydrate epimerase, partial [Duncaniella freteri]|nr:bifunctional ADP-dependent NAD(P)H-hydrate dehydratase/NAD(P)H-hydrate epimerase [Duncaniella freteri]